MRKEDNMNIKLSFSVSQPYFSAISIRNNKKTLEITSDNNELTCNIYYDFKDEPLQLKAKINVGDKIDIILMNHRIELHINGYVCDEEWPAGSCLYEKGDKIESSLSIATEDYAETKIEQPSIIGSFKNAEGWKPENNIFVGDCMPYVNDGKYHVLYLKDRHHHTSKWKLGAHQWEHISTSDFENWDIHPMAVAITDWYEGSICTGSWIKKENTEYLFYTIRMYDRSPAKICRSISNDGYHFEKDRGYSFTLSDKYHKSSARDPKIVLDDKGIYHMFLTTSLVAEKRGCLAHLVSSDLDTWKELDDPIYISDDETVPECPDYIKYGEYYYLIYSLHGKAHYMYSKDPFSNWIKPKDPIIPCSSVPKGAVWGGKIIFTGFKSEGGYAGTMTFKTAVSEPCGELIFE